MDESIFEIGRKTQAKGKPRINPIPDKTAPTKSTKNPYQKQTEGLKRANVSKANYAAYNENPTAMASEINIQNYPQTRREKVENEGREGAKRKGMERKERGVGEREKVHRDGRRGESSKEVKSGYGRSQIAGDAAKGNLAFVGRKERGIIRADGLRFLPNLPYLPLDSFYLRPYFAAYN